MNGENNRVLLDSFPSLFETCYYFECGDGWATLIKELAHEIVSWSKHNDFDPRVTRVKEKYGTLRFYMESETDEISKMIEKAEEKSSHTCETCGSPGVIRGYRWRYTACDNCAAEILKKNLS